MRQVINRLEMSDYLEILRRRVWMVLACLLVGLLGAGVAFLVIPKTYRSSTLILVESQKVPTDFIKPVTVDTIEERLITIQQQIFSRTLLRKIIEEFGLYKDRLAREPLEDVIEDMRKDIKVTTVDDRLRRNIQAFTIAYEGVDPLMVMKVTNKLAALFIEENLRVREQLIEGTSEFLENELKSVREKLVLEEKQISEYKMRYKGELPAQVEANLRTLDRLQMELQNANETVRMSEEKREILRDFLKNPGSAPNAPYVADSQTVQLEQLRAQLVKLRSEFKDTYPDVVETKRLIGELETELASGAPKSSSSRESRKEVESSGAGTEQVRGELEMAGNRNLTAQIRALSAEIAMRKQRRAQLENLIRDIERRVEASPKHEQQLSVLLRDYENNRLSYEKLQNNKIAASISENLEKRQKGEQFRIVDPANLPISPVKPDPLRVFLGGLAAGFVLVGGTIWWKDLRNLPFRRPEEVEAALESPCLATIPPMSGSWERDYSPETEPSITVEPRGKRAWPAKLFDELSWRSKRNQTQLVAQENMNALSAEQFRVLAGRVIQLRDKKGARILAITSALVGEGKTTVSVGLAVTLARDYLVDTILIDGDMRNAAVSARLGRHDDKGLMNVLAGECDLNAALFQHAHRNLRVLCAGKSNGDQFSLPAMRGEMQKLLDSLRHRDVLVIVDGPPILPMADMSLYAEIVDGILMVVRGGKTPQRVVIEALDFLERRQIEGVVLNDYVNMQRAYYAAYGYSHYALAEPKLLLHQPRKHDSSSSSHKGAA